MYHGLFLDSEDSADVDIQGGAWGGGGGGSVTMATTSLGVSF